MANDLETLRKVMGLLGSDHEGERAAAALKATAILKGMGKTWADVTVGAGTTLDDIVNSYQRPRQANGRSDYWDAVRKSFQETEEMVRRANEAPYWPAEPTARLSEAELCRQVEFYLIQHSAKAMGIGSFSLRELHRFNEDGIVGEAARLSAITILHKLWKTHRPVAA